MPLVVQPAADVVQKHTIEMKLFAVGIHGENINFAVPVKSTQHWYDDEAKIRQVYNQVVRSVFPDNKTETDLRCLNDQVSKFEPVEACEIADITKTAWKMFATQTECGNVTLATSQNYQANNGFLKKVIMGNLSYFAKNGEHSTKTSLNIWFFEGSDIRGVLLPGGMGMSYNTIPTSIPNKSPDNKSQLQISTLVGTQGKTDRYIPRHNKARFEYASQKMNCASTIDISKAVTRAEQHALLAHDNLDFMQSLGVADVPHSTTALHSNSLGMHIYINSCTLQGENHVVQNIYF